MFVCLFVCLDDLDSLNCDPPGLSGLPEQVLHFVGDGLPLREDVPQLLRAKHVPEKRKIILDVIVENEQNIKNTPQNIFTKY